MDITLEFNLPLSVNTPLTLDQFINIAKSYNVVLAREIFNELVKNPNWFDTFPIKTQWQTYQLFHRLNEQLVECCNLHGTKSCEIHIHEDWTFNLFPNDVNLKRNIVVTNIFCCVSHTGVYWEGWPTGNHKFYSDSCEDMLNNILASDLNFDEIRAQEESY